jgi:hypothetical protein
LHNFDLDLKLVGELLESLEMISQMTSCEQFVYPKLVMDEGVLVEMVWMPKKPLQTPPKGVGAS